MDREKVRKVLECLLFVTNRPVGLLELSEIIGETQEDVQSVAEDLESDLSARGSALQLSRVAEGFQLASRDGFGYWVKKLFKDQTTFRLSQSALETLSIIAYKQPITRAEIEEIRGVEVIGVLETLSERKLVKIAGRKESVGRPLLYATTPEFLRQFQLWKISDLPSLEDLAKEAERKRSEGEPVAAEPPGGSDAGPPAPAEGEPHA
ncbi:MAG: SMC-Scp complex subunit ScpB [Elusimicrobia bacterium RIFCSPLOWO2_01_FULL_64_13]|nr:MAG: SMC-Scp complex subunit ScpB [Elusimicrobia bacterium RIFCSPLOWO2_01_FULL_64_13]